MAESEHERIASPRPVPGREGLIRRKAIRLRPKRGHLLGVEDPGNQHAPFADKLLQNRLNIQPNRARHRDTLHYERSLTVEKPVSSLDWLILVPASRMGGRPPKRVRAVAGGVLSLR